MHFFNYLIGITLDSQKVCKDSREIIIGKTWKQPSRWVDKEDVVHIHNGILFNHEKKEILPFEAK